MADSLATPGFAMTDLAASGLVGAEESVGTAGIEGAKVIVGCLTAARPVMAEEGVGIVITGGVEIATVAVGAVMIERVEIASL
jgi:hypothetical protein